jgi:hypothetical protein
MITTAHLLKNTGDRTRQSGSHSRRSRGRSHQASEL